MTIIKEYIRFFIRFAFNLKKNAAETSAMICATYGENDVILHVVDGTKKKKISVLKMNRVLDTLKKLKRTNSKNCWIFVQIERELAEQLGVMQQAISVYI